MMDVSDTADSDKTGSTLSHRPETIELLRADPHFGGLARSFDVYYGDPDRDRLMDALYARFLTPGCLAFDIGAHVGDRIASFRRLGASVVALEPQPLCYEALSRIFASDGKVWIGNAACARVPGRLTFHINDNNPTVSTASSDFVSRANGAQGWEGQCWNRRVDVEATTLDALVAEHGLPDFIKVDVEGFEDEVLAGLTSRPRSLSFEFTTIERDVAIRALHRLEALGFSRFNIAIGESQLFAFSDGGELTPAQMRDHLVELPHEANSGDIYALA